MPSCLHYKGPKVKFLREKLEKLGCELPRHSFVCRPCEGLEVSGGFVPPTKDAKGNSSLPEVRRGTHFALQLSVPTVILHIYNMDTNVVCTICNDP